MVQGIVGKRSIMSRAVSTWSIWGTANQGVSCAGETSWERR